MWGTERMEVEPGSNFLSGPTDERLAPFGVKRYKWTMMISIEYRYKGFLLDNGEPRGQGIITSSGSGTMGRNESRRLEGVFMRFNIVRGAVRVARNVSRALHPTSDDFDPSPPPLCRSY